MFIIIPSPKERLALNQTIESRETLIHRERFALVTLPPTLTFRYLDCCWPVVSCHQLDGCNPKYVDGVVTFAIAISTHKFSIWILTDVYPNCGLPMTANFFRVVDNFDVFELVIKLPDPCLLGQLSACRMWYISDH